MMDMYALLMGGSGGGGGSSNVVRVTFTYDGENFTADKTPTEVWTAFNGGSYVYGYSPSEINGVVGCVFLPQEASETYGVYFFGGNGAVIYPNEQMTEWVLD